LLVFALIVDYAMRAAPRLDFPAHMSTEARELCPQVLLLLLLLLLPLVPQRKRCAKTNAITELGLTHSGLTVNWFTLRFKG